MENLIKLTNNMEQLKINYENASDQDDREILYPDFNDLNWFENFLCELRYLIDNWELQENIFMKTIYSDNTLYLVDLNESQIPNSSKMLDITILGNKNKSNKRELYHVIFNKDIGNFKCDCKDFKFRCSQKNIVCKHITFIICKVLCIFDLNYFSTKRMTKSQIKLIDNLIKSTSIWKNSDLSIKFINSDFKEKKKNIENDDKCPICLSFLNIFTNRQDTFNADSVSGQDTLNTNSVSGQDNQILNCPDCLNYVHKDCMEAWLYNNNNNNCVYCRYPWDNYRNNIDSFN